MSISKVREYLKTYHKDQDIRELTMSSATVELAAQALSVEPARIAKTLSFHGNAANGCILIVTAGDAKIDNAKFKKYFGLKAKMLEAEDVSQLTGHDVGGVCPFANPSHVSVYLDVSLKRFDLVYPACGSANSAIGLTPEELETCSQPVDWIDVCKLRSKDQLVLGYGDSTVSIDVSGASSVTFLQGKEMEEISDIHTAFIQAITKDAIGIRGLDKLVNSGDLITIVVSDITRLWMRQDIICRELVFWLHDTLGVPFEQMTVLVALGTHRGHTAEEHKRVVSPEVYEKVKVLNHDCLADDLVFLGTTKRGTNVYVNPLVTERKVIIISGTVHHLMSGFGGGRKSILPGICGKETIVSNHLHCLDPDAPRSNPAIGCGVLDGNPVHEDMMEAASMVKPVFGINIIAGSGGNHARLLCGDWAQSWLESCEIVNKNFGVPIREKADIVIASCGGFPKDLNLYQGIKTLLNMSYAVKPGGTMIFLAKCQEGGGSPDFFDWRIPLRDGKLDESLRTDFSISGYIFYAGCESIARGKVLMLTGFCEDLTETVIKDMNISGFSDIEALLKQVDFSEKSVYVMPYGGNTVPYLCS